MRRWLVAMVGLTLLLGPAQGLAQDNINPLTGKPYSQKYLDEMRRLQEEEAMVAKAAEEYSKRDAEVRKEKADEIRADREAVNDWVEANPPPPGTKETSIATSYDDAYDVEQTTITYLNKYGIPTHTVVLDGDAQPTGPVTQTQQGKAWESIGPRIPEKGGVNILSGDDFEGNETIATASIVDARNHVIGTLEFNHEGVPWRGENFDPETGKRTGGFQDDRLKPPEDSLGGPLSVPPQVRLMTGTCEACRALMDRHNAIAELINAKVLELQSLSEQHQHAYKRAQTPIQMRHAVLVREVASLKRQLEAAKTAAIDCDKECRKPPPQEEPDPVVATGAAPEPFHSVLDDIDDAPVHPPGMPAIGDPATSVTAAASAAPPPPEEDVLPTFMAYPYNDGDLEEVATRAAAYLKAANCEGMECPKIDCMEARRAMQALLDMEAYLEAMLPYLEQADKDHLAHFTTLAENNILNGDQRQWLIRVIALQEFYQNFGSMLLDIASVSSFLDNLANSEKAFNEMSKTELLDQLNSLYQASKDFESGATTVASTLSGEQVGTPLGSATDIVGGVDSGSINNATATISDLKTITTEAIEIINKGGNWKDVLKKGNVLQAIGQTAGRHLKAWSQANLDERKARLKDLTRDANAGDLVQAQSYINLQRAQNRLWAAVDALAAVQEARAAYAGCVTKACGLMSFTRPPIPTFEQDVPGAGTKYRWGAALRWFNGAIERQLPKMTPALFIDEDCPPEEKEEPPRADPGEMLREVLSGPVTQDIAVSEPAEVRVLIDEFGQMREDYLARLARMQAACDEAGYNRALADYARELRDTVAALKALKPTGPRAAEIESMILEALGAFAMTADEALPPYKPCPPPAGDEEDPVVGESILDEIGQAPMTVGQLPEGVTRPELADTTIEVPASFCDEFERVAFLNDVYNPTAARALANSQAARVHQNRLNSLFTEYMRNEGGPVWAAIQKEMAAYGPIADQAFEESNRVNGLYAQIIAVPIAPCAKLAEAEPPPALAVPSPPTTPVSDPKKPDCPPEERKKRRQPIEVGPNGKVGSGARFKSKAASTALGLAGGLLGGGGGSPLGGGGGGGGPQVVRCKIKDSEMTVFTDPLTGVSLKVGAKRAGDTMVVFADIDKSPDNGTFQTGFMENAAGDTLAPADVNICDLWGEWKLTVSWTRSTYVDGALVSRESGGWSEGGLFRIPGMLSKTDAPDGLWKRLGFSNASHGARKIAMQYKLPPGGGPVDMVIHITRPGEDPVTTVPFALTLTEGPGGIAITQAAPIKDDCPPEVIAAAAPASIADSPPPAPPSPPKPALPPATSQPRAPIPTEDLMALEKRIDEEKANNLDEKRLQLLSVCRPTILPWTDLRDALYERGAKWLKELEAMVPTGPLADGVRETITAEKARVRDLMDRLRAMKEPECLPAPAEPSGPEDILEEIETPFVPA